MDLSDVGALRRAALLCIPAFLGGWLLTTGAMQFGARALGGGGRFEDLATATAWAIGVATLFTLVMTPVAVIGFLVCLVLSISS